MALTICWSDCFLSPCLSLWLKLTVCNYQSGHPSFCPPSTRFIWSLPLVCLSVRNERNLQQKQQLAGGPMSHDALHGAHHPALAPHLAFYCVRSSTITFTFADTHLFYAAERLACVHAVDNDNHRQINSPQAETDRRPWYWHVNHCTVCNMHRKWSSRDSWVWWEVLRSVLSKAILYIWC